MFAIIKTGGKQYKVTAGEILKLEKLPGESGSKVDFSEVILLHDGNKLSFDKSVLSKSRVIGTILEQKRSDKIIVFKKKRRQGYDRKNGHRQYISVVHMDEIFTGDKSLAKSVYELKSKDTVSTKISDDGSKEKSPAKNKPVKNKPTVSATKDTKRSSAKKDSSTTKSIPKKIKVSAKKEAKTGVKSDVSKKSVTKSPTANKKDTQPKKKSDKE